MTPPKTRSGWSIQCAHPDGTPKPCGFQLRVHDREQLVELALRHCDHDHVGEGNTADGIRAGAQKVTF